MIVNCTSAEVKGLPSWNFTSLRNLKVTVLPSGATFQLSARLALGLRSKPYSSSPSYTLAVIWPIGADVEMYGARFGGSGWVICTSVPPGFWALVGPLANSNAATPHDARTLQRNIAMTGLLRVFYRIARNQLLVEGPDMGLPELSYLASMTGLADQRVAEVHRFAPS